MSDFENMSGDDNEDPLLEGDVGLGQVLNVNQNYGHTGSDAKFTNMETVELQTMETGKEEGLQDYYEHEQDDGMMKDPLLQDQAMDEAMRMEFEIKMGFLRKVYSLLALALGVTVAMVFAAKTPSLGFESFLQSTLGQTLFWVFDVLTIVVLCAAFCWQRARYPPMNYVCLFLFIFFQSYVVAFITTFYPVKEVLFASGTTAVVTFALTVYACTTKTNYVAYNAGGAMLTVLATAIIMCLVSMVFFGTGWKHTGINLVIAVIYGFFLIHDTQQLMGGAHGCGWFSVPDMYVIAVLIIYVDVVMLFLRILAAASDN